MTEIFVFGEHLLTVSCLYLKKFETAHNAFCIIRLYTISQESRGRQMIKIIVFFYFGSVFFLDQDSKILLWFIFFALDNITPSVDL